MSVPSLFSWAVLAAFLTKYRNLFCRSEKSTCNKVKNTGNGLNTPKLPK